MADLHSIAHELYGLPLAEFTATRDAWAATERDGCDAQLARDVRALRKPNATAWAVNMVARAEPDLLEELVELGSQLRQAQADADGARLRSLDQERRRLMAHVSAAAKLMADQQEQSLGATAAAGIAETMKAALADPEAGRAVLNGMLVAGLSAPGFGAVDLSDTVAIEHGAAAPKRPTTEITQARETVSATGREAAAAGKAAATARARRDGLVEQRTDLERHLEDLQAQVDKAERRLAAIIEKVQRNDLDIDTTSRAEAAALQALEEAEERVADLEG